MGHSAEHHTLATVHPPRTLLYGVLCSVVLSISPRKQNASLRISISRESLNCVLVRNAADHRGGWRGATYAPYKQSLANGRIGHNERALLFTSATSVKYPLPTLHRTLDISKEIDFHGALVLD
jgi:hypothetical protein